MGRESFRARNRAVFYMAGQARVRRCQYDNVYFLGTDDNKFVEYVAENFTASVDLDFLEPVSFLGGVADEFILADRFLQLYVDVILPIIFCNAVCKSIAVGRGGQFDFEFFVDDIAWLGGGLVE